jgi:hypothetical protein
VKKIYFAAAALLSLSAMAPAQAEGAKSFSHAGVDYTYSVTELSGNRRVIEGRAKPGSTFRLVVANGRVFGTANGSPVSFRVADVAPLTESNTRVATR